MKVRKMTVTRVRTMVKMKVNTDGYQHQHMFKVTTEVWERGGPRRVCEHEG